MSDALVQFGPALGACALLCGAAWMARANRTARECLTLLGLCALVYFAGPTTVGLINVQESLRVLAAAEMQEQGEWIVPTIHGHAYLDKPPLMYWLEMTLAWVMGRPVDDLVARLVVAIAGTAGVVATYGAARELLRGERRGAAWWAGAFAATGPLYVRSSRIAEIDILLVATVAGAVALVHRVQRAREEAGRTAWGPLAGACGCAALAGLAKGPPGIALIGVATIGGAIIRASWDRSAGWAVKPRRIGLGLALAAAAAAFSVSNMRKGSEVPGVVIAAAIAGSVGWCIGGAMTRARLRRTLGWVGGPAVLAPLAAGVLVLTMWLASAATQGPAADPLMQQTGENLVIASPRSALEGVSTVAYGAGLGSVFGLLGIVMVARRRAAPPSGLCVLVAWAVLGFAMFALLARGSGRYLTPVWPALAMLGGWQFAAMADGSGRGARNWRRAGVLAVAALAIGQAAWYGAGLGTGAGHRSPREIVAEVIRAHPEMRERLAMVDFYLPAFDVYAQESVRVVRSTGEVPDYPGQPMSVDELRQEVRAGGAMLVFGRVTDAPNGKVLATPRVLERAGLRVEAVALEATLRIDKGRTDVGAWMVSDAAGGGRE